MATPNISIVIPTHNRPQILRQCLERIAKQTVRDQLEVIVVIDGEDPKTAEMLSSLKWPFPLTCFAIPKSQQGVARNRGIAQARGEIVLFIGDDIFLAPDACERHLAIHTSGHAGCHGEVRGLEPSHEPWQCRALRGSLRLAPQGDKPLAVLGHTTWDPAISITPVMRWLEETGWQFGYTKIAEHARKFLPPEIQHRFTYTSHISIPRAVARDIPFHEDVTLYGWEDIEWGIRLRNAGISLFYEPRACALHHHHLTVEDSLKRMETLGISAQIFAHLHPKFDRVPHGGKRLLYYLLALLPTLRGKHAKAFLNGFKQGNNRL